MQNDSYWYHARKDIGGALHLKREVERLTGDVASHFPRGVGFEGFYYAKQTNQDGDLVPMRTSAGTAPTAVKAWALAENACKARDSNPADLRPGGQCLLGTHFRALVVSPFFQGLTQTGRLELVVNTLLDRPIDKNTCKADKAVSSALVPPKLESLLGWVPEPKGFPLGTMTSKPPFCACLTWLGASRLSLELKTPAQWDSQMHAPREPECHGATRGRRGKLAQSLKSAVSIKEAESPGILRRLLNQGLKRSDPSLSFNASLRSAHSTVVLSGDPLGHFFHSLPPGHQNFVLAKQRHADEVLVRAQQKAVARAAGVAYVEEQPKKKATLLSHDTNTASALAKTNRDPLKEQRFRNAHSLGIMTIEQKNLAQIAIRLQRMYRSTMLLRALRRRNRRHFAAVWIQRNLRGYYGRIYYALFASVAALAVTRIAARYRVVVEMRQTELRRVRMNAAAKMIQACLRRRHAFHYVCWVRENWRHASALANIVRKFLAASRCELGIFGKMPEGFYTHCRQIVLKQHAQQQSFVIALAASRLGAIIRGVLCRSRYYERLSTNVEQRVILLAQRLLQRVARGRDGRRLALRSRQRREKAIEI